MLTTLFDFILEIVAVFLGVFAAFWLDKYREDRAERRESDRVLNLIRTEVSANKDMLEGMKQATATAVQNVRPIRSMWEGLTNRLGLVRKDQLLSEATQLYFLLANADKMLDVHQRYAGEYQFADSKRKEAMEPILQDQHKHFMSYVTTHILPKIDRVLTLIDSELNNKQQQNVSS